MQAKIRQYSVGDTIQSDDEEDEVPKPAKLNYSKASATTKPTERVTSDLRGIKPVVEENTSG